MRAAIGAALTDSGFPVVEGLLSLVHLDHAIRLLRPLPTHPTRLVVTATPSPAVDTEVEAPTRERAVVHRSPWPVVLVGGLGRGGRADMDDAHHRLVA